MSTPAIGSDRRGASGPSGPSSGGLVDVPPDLGPIAPVPVRPGATGVSHAVRGGAAAVSGAVDVVRAAGMPDEWAGLTAGAAGTAYTWFGREGDATVAALEAALVGLDRYLAQMEQARARRDWLDDDRTGLNADLDALRAEVCAAAGPALHGAALAQAQSTAQRLSRRRAALVDEIATLAADVERYEDDVIAVLESVDTDAEARSAARDPARPDVAGLRAFLHSIVGDPRAVRRWWASLTPAEREALTVATPGLVGTTDGVPVVARDDANRAALRRDLAYLRGLETQEVALTAAQRRRLANAAATEAALARGVGALHPHTGAGLGTFLLDYDPDAFDGDGRCAIAFGDPDTARRTAVIVPGFSHDMSTMASLAQDGLHVEHQAHADDPRDRISTVVWMGYDAPNLDGGLGSDLLHGDTDAVGVGLEAKAATGGHELVDVVRGLRATHRGAATDLTVIGHSYGSTTVAHAASDGMHADEVVLVGSPGAGDGVHDVAGLRTAPGHVYVGAAENDPVTWLGGGDGRLGLGQDPSQASFGAIRFSVADGPTFHPEQIRTGFHTHGSYFDPGSTSLANIGRIVDGQPPAVVPGRDEPAHTRLDRWLLRQEVYEARHRVLDPVVGRLVGAGKGLLHGAESGFGSVEGLFS